MYHKHSGVRWVVTEKTNKLLSGLAVSSKVIQYPYISQKDFVKVYVYMCM